MDAGKLVAWLRVIAWLVIAVFGLWILTQIHYTIVIFGLAAMMSFMLYPWVNALFNRRLSCLGRQLSWSACVVCVYLILPLAVGIIVWVSLPAVNAQVDTISVNLPKQMEKLQGTVTYWQGRFEKARLPQPVRAQLQTLIGQAINRAADIITGFVAAVANGILNTFTWMVFLLMALIISLFMLLNLPEMRQNFYEAVPNRFRDEVRQVMHEVNFVFGGFIKGTFILCSIASVVVFVLLSSLQLLAWAQLPGFVPFDYTLVIALLTLVCYPIPILGLTAVTLLGALAAYFQNGSSTAYTATVICMLVGALVSVDRLAGPRVMSKAMGVSPLFVMFAAFAGAELMGFWGIILGVPVAAAVKVLFRYVRSRFLVPHEGDMDVASMLAEIERTPPLVDSYKMPSIEPPSVLSGTSGTIGSALSKITTEQAD